MKTCNACGGTKPLTAYNADTRQDDGHARTCRTCARARGAAYRARNLASVRARERVNAETYRNRHPEHRRAIVRESARRRRAIDPLGHRLARHARRPLPLANSQLPITWHELVQVWDARGIHACVYCDMPFQEIDHIEPIALGGQNHVDNLVPACETCNRSKGAKPLAEWLPGRLAEVARRVAA